MSEPREITMADAAGVCIRIAVLEADLAASREREAALAAALAEAQRWFTPEQTRFGDPPNVHNAPAILAAHDAEVRKPLEEKIAEYAAALDRLMTAVAGWQYVYPHLGVPIVFNPADILAEVRREAKVEALQKVLGAANKEADRDPELRESYATMLVTAITDHLVALKAEKGGK